MIISWYGQACFKIQSGEKALILDPFEKSIGLTPPAVSADIVAVTHDHKDHNNFQTVKGEYFLINSPGEYEIKGVKIAGIPSFHDNEKGAKRGLNTMYLIEFEGMRVLHMGDFGQDSLEDKQSELLGTVDILMVPVGGTFTIDAKGAVGIINQIEPKIVIPMHYKISKLTISELDGVDKFIKEFGGEDVSPQDKLTIKHKDLGGEDDNMKLVILKV
ncbi:MAG: hypothetical protein A3B96_02055 [Candidatus Spechtbacteria bacterium RIFCSPHIGHO2_02_FULL_43_15b]|nr:MAG: hypothetical protein A3B96_02055 [Candidatus Spechtbacteria bacterium RIFCSPHIGHO2_02_FULL_43_15b]